jgi:small-conductance mechanosensitive channel
VSTKEKELHRLDQLEQALKKQKYRCVKLMEQDIRLVGVQTFAKHIGVKKEYLYNLFDGWSVSIKKVKQIWDEAESYVKIANLKGGSNDNRD